MDFFSKHKRDLEWFQEYTIKWMTAFALGIGVIFSLIGFITNATFTGLSFATLAFGLIMMFFVLKDYYSIAAGVFFIGLSFYIFVDAAMRGITGNLDYMVVILVASGILVNLGFTVIIGISSTTATLILTALGFFDWLPVTDPESGLIYLTAITAAVPLQIMGLILALMIRRVIMKHNIDLQESKEGLQMTLKSIAEGVITTENSGVIVMANKEITRLSRMPIDEIKSKTIFDLFHIFDEFSRDPITKETPPYILETESKFMTDSVFLINHKNERFICEFTTSKILGENDNLLGYITVLRDVTYQRELFNEIIKNQKNKSVKLLSGGIAHDFNNILTRITNNLSLLEIDTDEYSVMETTADLEKAVESAKKLTQQLMNFSQDIPLTKEETSIDELVTETTKFMLKGTSVELRLDIDENLWDVRIDRGQIEQVIQNIVLNALQAMNDEGLLSLQIRNILLPKKNTCNLPYGAYVLISITDSGPGIPEDQIHQVFDPYFSTKEDGHGIGLAVCNTIVKNHGGTIKTDNIEGSGARFYFYLPAIHELENNLKREKTEQKNQALT